MYVSKLTIKLLEEGFSLQQHLLALRRYHMMESADWADLFIVSLSHRVLFSSSPSSRRLYPFYTKFLFFVLEMVRNRGR